MTLALAPEENEPFFPAPAVNVPATIDVSKEMPSTSSSNNMNSIEHKGNKHPSKKDQTKPGCLPSSSDELSNAARGLLLRLLDTDPKVRLRNLRQLQQTAFYLKFNFEHIKAKKISPRCVLESQRSNFNNKLMETGIKNSDRSFIDFDQPIIF